MESYIEILKSTDFYCVVIFIIYWFYYDFYYIVDYNES